MKRKSPIGQTTGSNKNTLAPARRPEYVRPRFESLEDRKMLAAYINEIYLDPPGGGGDMVFEYIELRGTANMSLADHYLIQVENEGAPMGNPGDIDMIWDLSSYSFGSNGFLTMRQYNPTPNQYTVDVNSTNIVAVGSGWGNLAVDDGTDGVIENSGGTFMLINNVSGAAPSLTDDLDTDNNGLDVATGKAGWVIEDAIGIHSEFGEAAAGILYAPVNFGPEATTTHPHGTYVGLDFEIEYIGRWGDSTGQTAADWHISNLTDDPRSGHTASSDFRQSSNPHGLAVTDRQVFYNDSLFDNQTAGGDPLDNGAIDTTKSAYMPGNGILTSASVTSYSRGLNGIMVDIGQNPSRDLESSQGVGYGTNLTNTLGTTNTSSTANPEHRSFSLSDFEFSMSEQGLSANNTPSSWSSAPAPTISALTDTPSAGTDRIELIWANNAIENRYLEVTVKGRDAIGGFNNNTGLTQSDIFYFGNMIADTFNDVGFYNVDASDEIAARGNQGVAFSPSNLYDFNKDFSVDASDQIIARSNGDFLLEISIGNPPPAPAAPGGAGSAVASALAAPDSASHTESALESIAPYRASSESNREPLAGRTMESAVAVDPRVQIELDGHEADDILGPEEELVDLLAAVRAE